jgi:hypothetical protein
LPTPSRPWQGRIQRARFVTIRWVVTPQHEAIYVGGELRFEHSGDYSNIDRPVSVFPGLGSRVTVKSIRVKTFTSSARPAALPQANALAASRATRCGTMG